MPANSIPSHDNKCNGEPLEHGKIGMYITAVVCEVARHIDKFMGTKVDILRECKQQ
jgi:hypothetical protein